MFFAIPMLLLQAALLYFAFVGIKYTVESHRGGHGLTMVRDLFKYAALLIAVVITCFGLAGLLTQLIDNTVSSVHDKLDAARWLSFVVVGIPIIAIIYRWIKRDFSKNPEASNDPAWQIYLLAATSFAFLVWFIPLANTLLWFAGGPYQPRALSREVVAFLVWLLHLALIRNHRSVIANIHRFIGWFSGAIGLVVAAITAIDYAISKATDLYIEPRQLQEAIILGLVSAPVLLYYWHNFDNSASSLEARIYRTFGGIAVPILFYTIAGTFAIHQFLSWNFDTRYQDRATFFEEVPQQIGAVIVLIPTMLYFRKLVAGADRDDVVRIFQYLISAGGSFAIGLGTGAITAGLLDKTDKDAILFGISLLIMASYTWYRQWSHCQFAVNIDFEGEHHSPIRKFYLLAAVGVPTLVSIGAATWLTYRLFEALFVGGVERLKFAQPTGFLVGAGIIALYHLQVARKERD